jgi:hypothetical protein
MGIEIDRDSFDDGEYQRFEERLQDCLSALRDVLARPGFGQGDTTIGAELELHLVDAAGRPAPINRKVLAGTVDPRITLEVDRFNLEVNTRPVAAKGTPFSALAAELEGALREVRRAASQHAARAVTIGILPTLTERDLTESALTDGNRYRALVSGLKRLRQAPAPVRIEGDDSLSLDGANISIEGANTSFQVHLRVPPADFARTYNAAQMATAPVLAAACNSPLFLGRRLWDETRIALFRQVTDDRAYPGQHDWRPVRVSFGYGWVRRDAFELFAESVALHPSLLPVLGPEDPIKAAHAGLVPDLAELRLHQGTVWRWNRAVYDKADGGHLRIELRALPSGPTVTDMVANAALLLGLTVRLSHLADEMMAGFTFSHALRNFYQAARFGLRAELLWPEAPGRLVRPIDAPALLEALLPLARDGLLSMGVDAGEADRWLAVVGERVRTGRTGARFQREVFDSLAASMSGESASRGLLERYQAESESDRPVHEWPLPK